VAVKQSGIGIASVGIVAALLIAFAPVQDSVAFVVAILCGALGLSVLSFNRDEHERALLIRLFTIAFVLRVVFTFISYKVKIINLIGGGDQTLWIQPWNLSRSWAGWPIQYHGYPIPETLGEVYTGGRNMGYYYWSTWFYYLLNVPSQMALSFTSCFINSLTVVVIYKSARLFFQEKSAIFAAGVAIIFPGFVVWSALTIKETWIIFFEITAFYATWRYARTRQIKYALLLLAMIVLALSFRFYVTGCLLSGAVLTIACAHSARPLRTAFLSTTGLMAVLVVLTILRLTPFDLSSMAMTRLEEMTEFRMVVSGAGARAGMAGVRSGVQLDYDITTPSGAAMMIVIGSTYVLFSPFPWNLFSARQALALPDVLLWYGLVFAFIAPGLRHAWRHHKHLLISVAAFTLPLLLLYSMTFGNVGLAYRQRAQLMPFILMLAAAGYESRLHRLRAPLAKSRLNALRQRLQRRPASGSLLSRS